MSPVSPERGLPSTSTVGDGAGSAPTAAGTVLPSSSNRTVYLPIENSSSAWRV
jgi:hypothetical protein